VNDMPSEAGEDSHQADEPTIQGPLQDSPGTERAQITEQSIAPSESSFAPGNAISSTPATTRMARTHDSIMSDSSDGQGSWNASVESPFVRLDRDFQKFSEEENATSQSVIQETPSRPPVPHSRDTKGKGREQPLLRSILKPSRYEDSTITTPSLYSSPARQVGKIKTPIPKDRNPFLPANTTPANWSGVVDLRDPSMLSPQRMRSPQRPTPSRNLSPSKIFSDDDDDDDWQGGLPPGMSPPRFMSPARPPRKSAELGLLKLGQTPGKEAAARIAQDLVKDFQRRPQNTSATAIESSMSSVPTPPSLSRYGNRDKSESATIDTSLENEMARMQTRWASSSVDRTQTEEETIKHAPVSKGAYPFHTPGQLVDEFGLEDEDSFDDDMVNNTAYPSAAFLMASARAANRSFDSEDSAEDSLIAEDAALEAEGGIAIHPFDRVGEYDDSFDDSFDAPGGGGQEMGTETLFGIPRGQPAGSHPHPDSTGDSGGLRLHGHDVFDDTIGMSSQMGHTYDSPTPAYRR
jgi:DASH complex subunit ASK1